MSNVTFYGGGRASLDSQIAPTKFVQGTGTIVQGPMGMTASNITVQDLSNDVGSAFGTPGNGIADTPNNIASPALNNITIQRASVLLATPTAAFTPSWSRTPTT